MGKTNNKNYKRSGKKNYPQRSNARNSKDNYDNEVTSGENDISYHAKDDMLLKDSASLAYSNALGTTFNWLPDTDGELRDSIPGLFALVLHPTIGHAQQWNDPINVGSRAMYSWIRHANSGHANYDAPDLAMYILGMSQLHSAVSWAKRLYGIAHDYRFRNRYTPRAYLEANGVDYKEFINHLADYRAGLNILIDKLSSLAIPKDLAYLKRAKWLYEGVYEDSSNPKCQSYMMVPDGFYAMSTYNDATALDYVKLSGDYGSLKSTLLTHEDVLRVLNEMLDAIWNQEDYNIMSGDILKAYGAENCEICSKITEDYTVNNNYTFEVLSEIQNATIYRANAIDDRIYQNTDIDGGQIKCDLKLQITGRVESGVDFYMTKRMITVPFADPKPADTMIATRWTVIPAGYGATKDILEFSEDCTYGTEIVVGARLCNVMLNDEGYPELKWHENFCYYMVPRMDNEQWEEEMSNLGEITKFDYHPFISVHVRHTDGTFSHERPFKMFDVDNYTLVTHNDLKKMHNLSTWTQLMWH